MKGSKQFLAEAKLFLMQFLVSWSIVCAFYCFSLCWLHDPQLKWKCRIPFFSPLWANDLNMESYTSKTIWKVQMYTCSFTDAAIRLTALLSIKLTNRFYDAVGLYSDRSQMTWKWSKNWKVANKAQPSVSLMLSQHFKSSVIYYCTDPW